MGEAPVSLLTTRAHMAAITGSPLGDIGIAPDASHLSSGGYHCGALDLRSINAVGNDDYSIRQPRDRNQYNADVAAGRNFSSAMDYPDDWPIGGRAAWIRFNNILRAQLGARDPMLRAIRGVNYTPDGTTKRRFDCRTLVESSTTDTVLWHTHIEWWRDTIGDVQARDDATTRLCQIARAAIGNVSLSTIVAQDSAPPAIVSHYQGDEMLVTCTNGSGAEQSINGVSVPANGRIVITPNGPWSVANASNFDTTYWKNTLWLTWAEIKDLCSRMAQPTTLSDAQTAQVSQAAHDGAASIVSDPALGQLVEDRAYAAAQHAESS